jgi:hypothetical protein
MNTNKTIGSNAMNRTSNTLKTGYQTTKNATMQTYNTFRSAHVFIQILTVFFMIILLVLLIMWIRNLYSMSQLKSQQSPFIVTDPVNAFRSNGRPVRSQRVPTSVDGQALSISFWMYIADWNYKFGSWKNILIKGNDDQRAPGLWLYPKVNSLHARINTHADYNEGCDIRNIPLQKWVHIGYVLNNRTVDIYVDGKLERSCVLRGVPVLNEMPVRVADNGGFYGQIAKMQYFTRPLEPNEIAELYSEGPYMPSKFNLNIFQGAEKEINQYKDEAEDEYNANK